MKYYSTFIIFLAFSIQNLFAQQEDTILLATGNGIISGSLLVPQSHKNMPVALIISGSGPTDRNGNNMMMTNNALLLLAHGLAENGIASLRYDKRGVGESKEAIVQESNLRFNTYVEDALAWVKLLSTDKRFGNIVIIGHSEGSLIGMIVAREKAVSKFISLAGAGRPAIEILREQLGNQPPIVMEKAEPILQKLEQGETVNDVPVGLYALFRPSVQPYLISWFKLDPRIEIAKLNKPVLIVQGTTDIQVSLIDADNLAKANPKAQKVVIDGMNHILKPAENDRQNNIATYNQPDLPLAAGLINKMVSFIK